MISRDWQGGLAGKIERSGGKIRGEHWMSKIKEMAERIYLQSRQRHRTHGRAVRSQAHTEHGSLLLQLQRGRAHLCANQTAVLHCAESKVLAPGERPPAPRIGLGSRNELNGLTAPSFLLLHTRTCPTAAELQLGPKRLGATRGPAFSSPALVIVCHCRTRRRELFSLNL